MRRMVSSRAALALMTFKAFALGALLALVVGVYVNADAGQDSIVRPPAAVNVDAYTQVVARKMAEHHCSATGFGAEQVPGSALVRTAQGKLRMVSFDEGWAIFTGDAPGTLVAVCLDEAPPAR